MNCVYEWIFSLKMAFSAPESYDKFSSLLLHTPTAMKLAKELSASKTDTAMLLRAHRAKITTFADRNLGESAGEFIYQYLEAKSGYGTHSEIFERTIALAKTFLQVITVQDPPDWAIYALPKVLQQVRHTAYFADGQVSGRMETNTHKDLAQRALSRFLNPIMQATETHKTSRRWSVLHVVNTLTRIYIQMDLIRLSVEPIRRFEQRYAKDNLELHFTRAQLVTFNYLQGYLEFSTGKYGLALQKFGYAFENCYKRAKHNRQLILLYLAPLRALLGSLASDGLLAKHGLTHYAMIFEAIKEGNIKKYQRAFDENEDLFLKHGTYLLIEHLEPLVHRSLLKKFFLITGESPRVSIPDFAKTLFAASEKYHDTPATECILSNLINKGFVKGYISNAHGKLVLSKQTPFVPPPWTNYLQLISKH